MHHVDAGIVLATWRTIFIVVFRGAVEPRHFAIAEPVAHTLVREAKEGGALLSVFEAGAFEVGLETREQAARLFEDAGRVLRAAAYVYEAGLDRAAPLLARAADIRARSETTATPRVFTDVASATEWLIGAAKLDRHKDDARELSEAIARLRSGAQSTP